MRVALISLEPWDQVWRRNQHLCAQLVDQGLVTSVLFVEPPILSATPPVARMPREGITVVTPRLRVPKRAGGLVLLGAVLRDMLRHRVDVVWVNDPALGVHSLVPGLPAVYDVTDDWREFDFPQRVINRLVRAEDRLATRAHTVVCSAVLRERWRERYEVDAAVVHNGVDAPAWAAAVPRKLSGPGPHVGYIGTLHEERLDVDLVLQTADACEVGRMHLVGPDALSDEARQRLRAHPKVQLQGPVPAADVPGWAKSLDVLVSPHLVTPFTLSLDAIKSYEYLASDRPIVATPTSGFQLLDEDEVDAVSPSDFVAAVAAVAAASQGRSPTNRNVLTRYAWSSRAVGFSRELRAAKDRATSSADA